MITKIFYGRKSSGKTEKLIKEISENTLFITNKCSVRYVLDQVKYKSVDVVGIEDIFSFLNKKLNLDIKYDEKSEFIKMLKNENLSMIDYFYKVFDFINRADNSIYAATNMYIGDKQTLSDISKIKKDKNIISKIDFAEKIISEINQLESIGYRKILIDELFYYEKNYSDLFSVLASKVDEFIIGISNISEKHKGYPIYKNSSEFKRTLEQKLENIDGMFIERVCVLKDNYDEKPGKTFLSKYFGTDVTSNENFDDIYCDKYSSIEDEVSSIASVIERLHDSEIAIALKDPAEESKLFKSELLGRGIDVNCETDNLYMRSPLTQVVQFFIDIKNKDISGKDIIHFQNIIRSNTKNTVRKFFKRFGDNIEVAIINGSEYDKESAEMVNKIIDNIKKIKDKKAKDILNEFKYLDTDLYEEIKAFDELEDMYVYIASSNTFSYQSNKVNIVSLKTAATKKVDYIFLPMMTEIKNIESEIISNSSIRKLNGVSQTGLLSSEDKYNIVLSDIYEALLMSKNKTFLSYALIDGDLNSQKCLKPLDNLFNTFKPYNEHVFDTNKLFEDLSVGLYSYKDTGIMTKKGTDAYYILQENPDNIQKINNIISDIEKEDLSFDKETMRELLNGKDEFSVTRVEMFNSCPFRQAIRYGLSPKEDKLYEENNATKGTFYHNAISEISKELWNEQLTDSEYLSKAKEIARKILSVHNEKVTITKASLFAEKENMINRAANASLVYKAALDKGDFKLISTEYTIEDSVRTPSGHNIELKGVIDRIDEADVNGKRYARIIDYKTSAKTVSEKMLDMGLQLQLPIYTSLLQTKCSGMYYAQIANYICEENKDNSKDFQLKGPSIKDEDILKANDNSIDNPGYSSNIIQASRNKNGALSSRSNVKTEEEIEEMVLRAKNIFVNTVDKIKDGENSIEPILMQGANPCEYCKYKSICHID